MKQRSRPSARVVAATEITGWQAGWHAVTPCRPKEACALSDLADARIHALVLERAGEQVLDERQARMGILHLALSALEGVVLAPAIIDGVAVTVAPDQIGVSIDDRGAIRSLWYEDAEVERRSDAIDVAIPLIFSLIEPVAEALREAGIPRRGLRSAIVESVCSACDVLELHAPKPITPRPSLAAVAAAGAPAHRRGTLVEVRADDGPPIALRVRRTCCVLRTTFEDGGCPTCPQLPSDAARIDEARRWLAGLDDREFRFVTGRRRLLHESPRSRACFRHVEDRRIH